MKQILSAGLLLCLIASCAKKESESELQQNIDLVISSPAQVLPNTISNVVDSTTPANSVYVTCNASGTVSGPRVRVRKVSLVWKGKGRLLPLILNFSLTSPLLESSYNFSLSSASAATISSGFFGVATDYIPEGSSVTYSNEDTGTPGTSKGSRCYFDAGSMPKLKTPLTGAATLNLVGKVTLSAIQQTLDASGSVIGETPVVKEVELQVTYSAGSIPL